MCRIAGIISRHPDFETFSRDVQKMTDVMEHGGPDDGGLYLDHDTGLAFGHRRLSLVDLGPSGHQPMLTPEEDLVVTFNGEIYNYAVLKAELITSGYRFQSECDTEVILAAFRTWGTEGFEKLQGMFAFALFDKSRQRTYLVRDRSGIKPLYYHATSERLTFSSEVKAFRQCSFAFEENPDWPVLFLAFGSIPEPYTTLSDVKMLPKGNILELDNSNGTFRLAMMKEAALTSVTVDQQEAQELVKQELTAAVKDHLIADAPIGVFLSGGTDSSILAMLADKLIGEQLITISVNFDDENFSEAKYQRMVVELIEGKHHSYSISAVDFNAQFHQAVAAFDQPSHDGINSWFVTKCAKENGLKAVLSGIGADELFGGYPSFRRIGLARKLQRLPNILLKLLSLLPGSRFQRLYYLTYQGPIGLYLFLRGVFVPRQIAKLLSTEKTEIQRILNMIPSSPVSGHFNTERQAAFFETELYMQNQLLKDTDALSMAHGIEVRVPFLDQRMIQLTESLNDTLLYSGDRPKSLLIESFKDILPKDIWDRPKMGFTFPFDKWLRQIEELTDPQHYHQNAYAKRLIGEFKKERLHWSKAFILFQLFKQHS